VTGVKVGSGVDVGSGVGGMEVPVGREVGRDVGAEVYGGTQAERTMASINA